MALTQRFRAIIEIRESLIDLIKVKGGFMFFFYQILPSLP